MNGNAFWLTTSNICSAGRSLKWLQRIDWPSSVCGNTRFPAATPIISICSISSSLSSRDFMNMRYVSCMMNSMGLVIPPSHMRCQMSSTLFFTALLHLLVVFYRPKPSKRPSIIRCFTFISHNSKPTGKNNIALIPIAY